MTFLNLSTSLHSNINSYAMYSLNDIAQLHRESKKGCHPNHGYNFVNSWWTCKILSLLQRAVNFQQNSY